MSLTTLTVTPGSGFGIRHDTTASGNDQLVKAAVPILGSEALVRSWSAATSMTFRSNAQTLASSTTVAEISDAVNLTQLPFRDLRFEITAKTAAGSPTASGLKLWILTSFDGTTWPGDVSYSGTAASYTLTGASNTGNIDLLGGPLMYSGNTTIRWNVGLEYSLTGFGIPPYFALLLVNTTTLALSSIAVKYIGRY